MNAQLIARYLQNHHFNTNPSNMIDYLERERTSRRQIFFGLFLLLIAGFVFSVILANGVMTREQKALFVMAVIPLAWGLHLSSLGIRFHLSRFQKPGDRDRKRIAPHLKRDIKRFSKVYGKDLLEWPEFLRISNEVNRLINGAPIVLKQMEYIDAAKPFNIISNRSSGKPTLP